MEKIVDEAKYMVRVTFLGTTMMLVVFAPMIAVALGANIYYYGTEMDISFLIRGVVIGLFLGAFWGVLATTKLLPNILEKYTPRYDREVLKLEEV